MSLYPRPDLATQIALCQSQIATPLNLAYGGPTLRRSVSGILGTAIAMTAQGIYGYLDYIAGTAFVQSAQGYYLDLKGFPISVPRLQGSAAAGSVLFSGNTLAVVPAGAVLQSADQSQSYQVAAAVTIPSGDSMVAGTVTALAIGAAGSLAAGQTLTLVSAVPGIVAQAVVQSSGLVPGVDTESDAAYRVRLLARQQETPQSGAGYDDVAWAKLLSGVTRAFVYPAGVGPSGAGTVTVAPLFDLRGPGTAAIPGSADLTDLAATIGPLLPVGGTVLNPLALTADVVAPAMSNLKLETGFVAAAVQASIATSLQNLFAGATAGGATFGDGIAYGTAGGTLSLSAIYSAIEGSDGVATFDLTSPTADIVSATGHIAVYGAPTFS